MPGAQKRAMHVGTPARWLVPAIYYSLLCEAQSFPWFLPRLEAREQARPERQEGEAAPASHKYLLVQHLSRSALCWARRAHCHEPLSTQGSWGESSRLTAEEACSSEGEAPAQGHTAKESDS